MILRAKKNRRRVDLSKKSAELRAVAVSHAPIFFRVLGATVASAAVVFGALMLFQWARQSPRFALTTIAFEGNAHASDLELSRIGGLTLGQNLLKLDALAVERLIAVHPWVKAARVNRRFPQRLEVEITEHRPVAMVSLGDLYLVDEDGEPFKRVQPSDALDLPIVTGIEREDYVARHDETVARLADALVLAHSYQTSRWGKSAPLSEVHLALEGVTLVTTDGQHVQLGEGAWPAKLARLARIRQELKTRSINAAVIRLDNRARPSSVTVSLQTNNSFARPERDQRTAK